MLIECLVQRVGPTTVMLDKVKLLFMPVPFVSDGKGGMRPRKKDEPTTSVCEVDKPEHLEYFRNYPHTYREYKEGQLPPAESVKPVIDMGGFSIVKAKARGEEGYVIFDKGKKLNAGANGTWSENRADITPFPSEYEAFQWLKDELASRLPEEHEEDEGSTECPICHRTFKPQGLAAHMRSCKGTTTG